MPDNARPNAGNAQPRTLEPGTGGLTSAQVAEKHAQGESNFVPRATSRPVKEILRANLFTVFNGILGTALVVVLALGDPRDALFGLVLVLNLAVGVISELRAKRALDAVAVLESPSSLAHRDGEVIRVESSDLVTEDLIELQLGDQVPVDGMVVQGRGLEIDESILTGESRAVRKMAGDRALAGTAVVAGSGTMRAEKVGSDTWAQQITAEAKRFSLAVSEIQQSIDRILRWVTLALPPVMLLLAWSQLRAGDGDWRLAAVLAVAGVIGMIPQGLVLLTSLNFAIGAATLARRGVLVQELPAVEILARVDRLCLDKTGTLTTGEIRGQSLDWNPQSPAVPAAPRMALLLLTADGANATAAAVWDMVSGAAEQFTHLIDEAVAAPEEAARQAGYELVPFSSARKWSALIGDGVADAGTWVLGAPEILLAAPTTKDSEAHEAGREWARDLVAAQSARGNRTICLAYAPEQGESAEHGSGHNGSGQDDPRQTESVRLASQPELPADLTPLAIITLAEDVRPDAEQTLAYFRDQGVGVMVISGDAPQTVAAIARRLGLQPVSGTELRVVDARDLPPVDGAEFAAAASEADVFGRVTPEQKRALVRSLQADGHTVAMTGDGVNDALALKEADLGIAMGSGAPATKAVSRMVLMNDEFAVLPSVVAEGRRIIANMERVSTLFLSKSVYALFFAVATSVFALAYPFLPRHLTYISAFTIGIPAFFLAIGPNHRRYLAGFLQRTLSIAVPSGLVIGAAGLASYLLAGPGTVAGQTAAAITVLIVALWLLGLTARPWNWLRIGLVAAMVAGSVAVIWLPQSRAFFALELLPTHQWLWVVAVSALGCILLEVVYRTRDRWLAALAAATRSLRARKGNSR